MLFSMTLPVIQFPNVHKGEWDIEQSIGYDATLIENVHATGPRSTLCRSLSADKEK
jgi:hypothetical protein